MIMANAYRDRTKQPEPFKMSDLLCYFEEGPYEQPKTDVRLLALRAKMWAKATGSEFREGGSDG